MLSSNYNMGCNCKKKNKTDEIKKRSMLKELRDNIESGYKKVKKLSGFIYETVITEAEEEPQDKQE